jgi:hypothetical protein
MGIDRTKHIIILNRKVHPFIVDRKPASSVIKKRCFAAREAQTVAIAGCYSGRIGIERISKLCGSLKQYQATVSPSTSCQRFAECKGFTDSETSIVRLIEAGLFGILRICQESVVTRKHLN